MNHKKEVFKFLSGFAAHEVLSHIFLSGSGLLPLHIFGFTVTQEYNAGIIVVWTVLVFVLMYYAWFKKD
ncbi:hypothetical protein HYV10_01550 [Candidatus Dependentiae bacterium]|nr:hypothetical protein [Candidatus Dependentiae bacterium]